MNEIRNYGKGMRILYTEDKNIRDRLVGNRHRKLNGWRNCRQFNYYFKNDKVVAWDILFPTFKLAYIRSLIENSLIGYRVSSAMWQALKGNKGGRHWEDLVDYTADELKKHLEKQFTKGMNWKNYGQWHIDHIIPKIAFSYKCPEDPDFKRCWGLENLQPLWAKDNISKGSKINGKRN